MDFEFEYNFGTHCEFVMNRESIHEQLYKNNHRTDAQNTLIGLCMSEIVTTYMMFASPL